MSSTSSKFRSPVQDRSFDFGSSPDKTNKMYETMGPQLRIEDESEVSEYAAYRIPQKGSPEKRSARKAGGGRVTVSPFGKNKLSQETNSNYLTQTMYHQ